MIKLTKEKLDEMERFIESNISICTDKDFYRQQTNTLSLIKYIKKLLKKVDKY